MVFYASFDGSNDGKKLWVNYYINNLNKIIGNWTYLSEINRNVKADVRRRVGRYFGREGYKDGRFMAVTVITDIITRILWSTWC